MWIPLIPGAFYTFICSTFIANATIGFNLPWTIAYPIGARLPCGLCGRHHLVRQEALQPPEGCLICPCNNLLNP